GSLDGGLDLSQIPLDADWAKNADAETLARFLKLVNLYEQRLADAGTSKWFVPNSLFSIEHCPKHKAFFEAGAKYKERMFMASNRTGKSIAGAFETACHATGIYPDWWKGHRFDEPLQIWACGADAKSTRNTAQKELLGPTGAWGTGMIPKELLGQFWALHGTPQAVDLIEVKHVSGGKSTIGFKNYKQELASFYGTAMDFIWFDEECPADIYNESLIRTMTTKGLIVVTFTPLAGLTPLVVKFCADADFLCGAAPIVATIKGKDDDEGTDARLEGVKRYKAVIQAGWDDAPWLDEESKAQMLEDTPDHLKDARSKGYPAMGSGNIYPFPPERVFVDPIHIPDSWPRMFALDVGWNVTAASWAAYDEASDTIWVYDEYYGNQGQKGEDSGPEYHIAQIMRRGNIVGVIDPAARQRSQIDGRKLMQIYKEGGLMLWPADNEVEGGIANISS